MSGLSYKVPDIYLLVKCFLTFEFLEVAETGQENEAVLDTSLHSVRLCTLYTGGYYDII